MKEREVIDVMRRANKSLSEIAEALERSKSNISRELKRNSSSEYCCYLSHRAQQRAAMRKTDACKRSRLKHPGIVAYVSAKLAEDWSPEQIAGRIKLDHPQWSISHEAIYQYIYDKETPDRKELIQRLRRAHRMRKPKGLSRRQKKIIIPNRISIDQRPKYVETRKQFGHWEGDSLVSRKSKQALNSLAERKSRVLLLSRINRKTASLTAKTIIRRFKDLPQNARRTLTLDNGTENVNHESITNTVGVRCFFAHPFHSWERGTNEHTNSLIRYYLPKGTDFATISDETIAHIERKINSRPRKCLGFKTPYEVASSFVALRG